MGSPIVMMSIASTIDAFIIMPLNVGSWAMRAVVSRYIESSVRVSDVAVYAMNLVLRVGGYCVWLLIVCILCLVCF